MKFLSAFMTGIFLFVFVSDAWAQQLRCEISSKFYCSDGAGCKPVKVGAWNLVDLTSNMFARCDQAGCDTYPMIENRSGLFISIDIPGRGIFAKMSIDGSRYVEVASLATNVFVSFGNCRPF